MFPTNPTSQIFRIVQPKRREEKTVEINTGKMYEKIVHMIDSLESSEMDSDTKLVLFLGYIERLIECEDLISQVKQQKEKRKRLAKLSDELQAGITKSENEIYRELYR